MHIYISGGCKNGKSYFAQRAAQALGEPLYYLATMISTGAEDDARIARHLRERAGWGFETLEQGTKILQSLERADVRGSFLLDSVTALLANEMFRADGFDSMAPERVAGELEAFVQRTANSVMVSDYLFADAGIYDTWTENYRRGLALIDRHMARCCDCVVEIGAGIPVCHKGVLPL